MINLLFPHPVAIADIGILRVLLRPVGSALPLHQMAFGVIGQSLAGGATSGTGHRAGRRTPDSNIKTDELIFTYSNANNRDLDCYAGANIFSPQMSE